MTQNGTEAIVSVIDMTTHQELEVSLREDVIQRDRFLATLSHELRNPLGAIMSAAQLLSHQADQAAQDSSGVKRSELTDGVHARRVISQQSRHMARLLDDLLDVSRVSAGKIEMRLEPIDLRDIINESIEVTQAKIDAHGHTLHTTVPPEPVWIRGDRARLLQVLENLLDNAAKYTPESGEITLALSTDASQAVLHVKDNGKGIPTALLDSIFDMFVQSDETLDRSEGGMGLGLALVRSLVELHLGQITTVSEGLGSGSTFEVRLPLVDAPDEHVPVSDETTEVHDSEPLKEALRVVLVEDQDDSRDLLAKLLTINGFEVAEAADGRNGLNLIVTQRPDVGIVDIGLPEMNGYEVASQVRQKLGSNTIHLVALTGYGQREDRERVLEAGFDDHLVKPVDVEHLAAILRESRARPS